MTIKSNNIRYIVAVGRSTFMDYSPAPDFTCGHQHRTEEAAEKCREKLIGYDPKSRQCSAKWYNSFVMVIQGEKTFTLSQFYNA